MRNFMILLFLSKLLLISSSSNAQEIHSKIEVLNHNLIMGTAFEITISDIESEYLMGCVGVSTISMGSELFFDIQKLGKKEWENFSTVKNYCHSLGAKADFIEISNKSFLIDGINFHINGSYRIVVKIYDKDKKYIGDIYSKKIVIE